MPASTKVSGLPHGSLLDIYEVHFQNFTEIPGAIEQNRSKLVCKLVGSSDSWMEETMATVGIFEAKTRFSEIVRQVEAGERFTITVRGEAKAQMVPLPVPSPVHSPEEVEAAYQRLRNPRIKGISHEEIRAAIEEGRP